MTKPSPSFSGVLRPSTQETVVSTTWWHSCHHRLALTGTAVLLILGAAFAPLLNPFYGQRVG
jgi:hypothetical protein